MDLSFSYPLLLSRQPRRGSLADSLTALVTHFDAWCRQARLKPHPQGLDAAWFLIAAAILAVVVWLISFELQMTLHLAKLKMTGQAVPNLPPAWFKGVFMATSVAGFQLLFCTLPAGRRIGIRQALIDYFTAEDPVALEQSVSRRKRAAH